MAKKVGQIRYYGEGNANNWPSGMSYVKLRSGAAFNDVVPIVQLGVQTLPGTKMFINSSINPVVVGATGIYELNIDGLSSITSLTFDSKTLATIRDNDSAYLIIDYVYEKES